MNDKKTEQIVSYWLGDSDKSPEAALKRHDVWYRGGSKVDEDIREQFEPLVVRAREGLLAAWEASPGGALGLVILLDQFTRNLFRGTREAYSGDRLAHEIATRAVAAGGDKSLTVAGRIFLYHPFHHSEDAAEQNRGVALLETLEREAPQTWGAYVRRSIEGFGRHRDVVVRFGRFPHRNRVLRRKSTPEELIYLESDPETYGQTKT